MRAYLERIETSEGSDGVNAFITVAAERALEQAARADEVQASGSPLGPLHGVPIALKDNMDTEGIRTTSGMNVLADWIPREDSAPARAIRQAGGIILGKTNMHEGSYGTTSVNPHFGPVRNPHDPARIAGGSSGGSAAAVASELAPAALGTDTGGSLRIPAALCGVIGFRPTAGTCDTAGVSRLSWSFDTCGPITADIDDSALLTGVLRGEPGWGADVAPTDLGALRVGVPGGYFVEDNHPEVNRLHLQAQELLGHLGANVVPVSVPGVEDGSSIGFRTIGPEKVVLTEEYFAGVEPPPRLDEVLDEFGADLRETFATEIGPQATPVLARDYARALTSDVPRLRAAFEEAMRQVDVLLTPTTPAPAAPIEESTRMHLNGRSVPTFETLIRYTFGTAATGMPAISLPAGHTDEGLPVGMQLLGKKHADRELLGIAAALAPVLSAC